MNVDHVDVNMDHVDESLDRVDGDAERVDERLDGVDGDAERVDKTAEQGDEGWHHVGAAREQEGKAAACRPRAGGRLAATVPQIGTKQRRLLRRPLPRGDTRSRSECPSPGATPARSRSEGPFSGELLYL